MKTDLVYKKEEIKCNNIIKQSKNVNSDYIRKEDIKEHNTNWPEILDLPHRILMVEGSESGKTNALLNLINHEPNIDKIYLCTKEPYLAKYQFSVNK